MSGPKCPLMSTEGGGEKDWTDIHSKGEGSTA